METACLISNRQELTQFLNTLAKESFFDKINRSDTKWKVLDINNITFYVNHIKDAPYGGPISLHDYIRNNHGLRNVSSGDNLCFFFVAWLYTVGPTLTGVNNLPKIYFLNIVLILILRLRILQAFNFLIFCTWRIFFELNFIVYELDGKVAKLVQRSREFYKETMRLNVYGNHLSVIVDFEQYCGVHQCVHSISCGTIMAITIVITKVVPPRCVKFFRGYSPKSCHHFRKIGGNRNRCASL